MIGLLAFAAAATLRAEHVLTVDPRHRLVEGIASDGKTIWLSSILDRSILACGARAGGRCRTLATLPKPFHPFAIAWDRRRQRLWIAADCAPGAAKDNTCERGALLAIDARGRLKTRIAPGAGAFHPGDVSASAGDLFVSDSRNGSVYRLQPSGQSLAAIVLPGIGDSAQGSALSEDGKALLVADYGQGIAGIDLATGSRTLLPLQDGKPLRGIDGLIRCGDTYYGIANATTPGALVAFSRTGQGIATTPLFGELSMPDPTQITTDGKRLLMVADSGWATLEKPGFVRTRGAEVWAVALPAG